MAVLKRILKWSAIILAALFVLVSILPYLIPLQPLTGSRHEQAFNNSEFSEVNGIEMHYRRFGGADAGEPHVLLVHGLGGSTFSWRYTAPALEKEGFPVIAVDLPGFGLSERRAGLEHSSVERAKSLWVLLDELEPGIKWHLVGHSMGGATVTAMALQEPDRVYSLTLAAGALAEFEPSVFTSLLRYPPVSRWVRVLMPRFLFKESWVEQALLSAYGRQPTVEEVKGYYYPLTLENTDVVFVDLINREPVPLLDRIGELNIPVLCIWGEDDSWVPLENGQRLVRQFPRADLVVIAEEGHCPMETSPDQFNAALIDFLKANKSR